MPIINLILGKFMLNKRYSTLILLSVGILAIFLVRALLAIGAKVPYTFHLFDSLTVAGALFQLLKGYRNLRRGDWITALILGTVIGVEMNFATLFTPYPFLGLVQSNTAQALIRGLLTLVATLGALVIMRQGGPVQFSAANGDWRYSGRIIMLGIAIGLPLAVLNVFALQFTQGQPMYWENPIAALLDAIQPGLMEEVVYRFTLWGLLWKILHNSMPDRTIWPSGLLAMLIHDYSHFDDLIIQSPLVAIAMGLAVAIVWGLPPMLLARFKGLESAIAFHWIQDVARFLAGF